MDVFGDSKVWDVRLEIPAKEYEAMQPAPGGFGPPGAPPAARRGVVAALAQPLPVDRAVLSLACGIAAWGGAPAAESTRLARAALQAPFEIGVDGLSWTVDTSFLALALTWAERFDEACAPLERVIAIARERGALIYGVVGSPDGTLAQLADVAIVVKAPPELKTPLVESFQAVVWHGIVSHPKLLQHEMKWEAVSAVAAREGRDDNAG